MTDAALTGAEADVERWLTWAYAQPARQRWLDLQDLRLNLREWGPADRPAVVLIHGGSAHTHWWDHVAPWLAKGRRVIAMDLSGHGDSAWRADGYTLDKWAGEALAVADFACNSGAPAVALVGHSLGGLVTLKAALRAERAPAGAIALDILAREILPEEQARRDRRASRASRAFPSQAAAIAAFRTLPDAGPGQIASVVRYVAGHSLREVADGWTWKTDRRVFLRDALPATSLRPVDFPICLIGAEHGLLKPPAAAAMAQRLGSQASTQSLSAASHHMMLDQPIALTNMLEHTLAAWGIA